MLMTYVSLAYPQQVCKKLLSICDAYCASHSISITYSMCSLAVSTQDSPAVEPRSNPGSVKILMSENLRLYITSPVVMC